MSNGTPEGRERLTVSPFSQSNPEMRERTPDTAKTADTSAGGMIGFIRKRMPQLVAAALAFGTVLGASDKASADPGKAASNETATAVIAENPLQAKIDKNLETLKNNWGLNVKYKNLPAFMPRSSHEAKTDIDPEKIADALDVLLKNLESTYHPEMVKKQYITIYLTSSLGQISWRSGKKEKIPVDSFSYKTNIVFDVDKLLDSEDVGAEKPKPKPFHKAYMLVAHETTPSAWADHAKWAKDNPHGEDDYAFTSKAEANEFKFKQIPDSVDFPSAEGRNGGIAEDEAELAAKVVDPHTIIDIVERAVKSPPMLAKLTKIIGCNYSINKAIFEDLSDKEYKEITGLPGDRYLRQSSKIGSKDKEKPFMDAAYFNARLRQGRDIKKLREEEKKKDALVHKKEKDEEAFSRIAGPVRRRLLTVDEQNDRNPLAHVKIVKKPTLDIYPAYGRPLYENPKKPKPVDTIYNKPKTPPISH